LPAIEPTPWIDTPKRPEATVTKVENRATTMEQETVEVLSLADNAQPSPPLLWVPHRQKHQDFAGRNEASVNALLLRMSQHVYEKTSGRQEPITPVLHRMSDLLAAGNTLSGSPFTALLSELADTIENWLPGPESPQDTLSGLDDAIAELATLVQEGAEEPVRAVEPAIIDAAHWQRRTIKPLTASTHSPFPKEILTGSPQSSRSKIVLPIAIGGGKGERLDSLLQQYYERNKGGATG
ncbi:MAG: hypothetical protein HQL07_14320, partial [Nitrospirae bacterium]|nr:hypothetical protein [Magnetococcales bacterium]